MAFPDRIERASRRDSGGSYPHDVLCDISRLFELSESRVADRQAQDWEHQPVRDLL